MKDVKSLYLIYNPSTNYKLNERFTNFLRPAADTKSWNSVGKIMS